VTNFFLADRNSISYPNFDQEETKISAPTIDYSWIEQHALSGVTQEFFDDFID